MATTHEPFDNLLSWLDSDRENAGQKYEIIRSGLIKIFTSKGFDDAEDLADVTTNRVALKLPEIMANYVGDPVLYFHGVARNIVHEARRRKELTIDPPPTRFYQIKYTSEHYDCLIHCLGLLTRSKRELILDYYLCHGRDKIRLHKEMAKELEISTGTLRMRAYHIRVSLEQCVSQCVSKSRRNE